MNKPRQTIRVNGLGSFSENISADEFIINGSCTVNGSVDALNIKLNGMLDIKNALLVTNLQMSGQIRAGEKSKIDDSRISGLCTFTDLTCYSIDCKGSMICKSIKCNKITLELDGKSEISSIDSKTVVVKLQAGKTGILTSKDISARKSHLEYTHVQFLKSEEVELANNCKIDLIQAKKIKKDDSSVILKEKPWTNDG